MIKLNDVVLPDDLIWVDEMRSWAVDTSTKWTLTGALVVSAASKQKGRPVTLAGGRDHGWCSRATVEALMLLQSAMAQMTLIYGSRTLTVIFAPGGIEAEPIVDYAQDGQAGDWYSVTLHLMEV